MPSLCELGHGFVVSLRCMYYGCGLIALERALEGLMEGEGGGAI